MGKDIILGLCECKEKQCTMKKYGDSLIVVCLNCDQTLAVVSKEHEVSSRFFNDVYQKSESELKKQFGKNPELLKQALDIKKGQKECEYKRKLEGNF